MSESGRERTGAAGWRGEIKKRNLGGTEKGVSEFYFFILFICFLFISFPLLMALFHDDDGVMSEMDVCVESLEVDEPDYMFRFALSRF